MKNIKLIILMGGKATRMEPLNYNMPKGMMSVNQKPAIYAPIIEMIKRGLQELTIVCNDENVGIISKFFNKAFSKKLKIEYLIQKDSSGPLNAFQLIKNSCNKEILLLLGDTLCDTENWSFDNSWLGYSEISDKSHSRWCLIETDEDNCVKRLIDKPDTIPNTNKVLVGVYFFKNNKLLNDLLSKKYSKHKNEYQLSSLIEKYLEKEKMYGQQINDWKDIGTLENYSSVIKNSLTGRYFNHFSINKYGILKKKSDYSGIVHEIEWYKKIDKTPLSVFVPQFFGWTINENVGEYEIEFVNSKTLAEYYVYYPVGSENWKYIYKNLLNMMKNFWTYNDIECDINIVNSCEYMYKQKVLDRIKLWDRQDILNQEEIKINGKVCMGFKKAWEKLLPEINKIINNSKNKCGIIHGDLSFQNILYLPETTTFKLIDPRGEFGNVSIFGDTRYEIAKLRHCYHGNYDYITENLFKLEEISINEYNYDIFADKNVTEIFDEIVKTQGFDIDEIELIEGLLFISMIPLHKDEPEMQKLFYLVGLECLNKHIK